MAEKGKGQLWFPISGLVKAIVDYEEAGKPLYEREKANDIRKLLSKEIAEYKLKKRYLELLQGITQYDTCPDIITDDNWKRLLKEPMDMMINSLLPQMIPVLRLRYGLDDGKRRTLKETGEELNRSGARMGQIVKNALLQLRHPSRGRYSFLLYGIEREIVTDSASGKRHIEEQHIDVTIESLENTIKQLTS